MLRNQAVTIERLLSEENQLLIFQKNKPPYYPFLIESLSSHKLNSDFSLYKNYCQHYHHDQYKLIIANTYCANIYNIYWAGQKFVWVFP